MPELPLLSPELLDLPGVRERIDRLQMRDQHWGSPASESGLVGGLAEAAGQANALVDRGADPVSATLYAFGARPQLFDGAWRTMTFLLVATRAHEMGLQLVVDDNDFEEILESLATNPSLVRVSRWVEPRLSPPSATTRGRSLRRETSGRAYFGTHRAPALAPLH